MKILKKLFYLIIFFILLLVVGGFLATRFIDPQVYKNKIIALVHEKTGRDLVIQGQIEFSFFPWVGMRVYDAQLSNAPGFQPANFASVSEIDVSVKLLPLLSRQVEVGKLTLRDLKLNLVKNKEGMSNWQDLRPLRSSSENIQDAAKASSNGQEKNTTSDLIFSIMGVNIKNADISWIDAQKGQNINLKNLQLESSHLTMGRSFPFTLLFDVNSMKPKIAGHVSFKSNVLANVENAIYQLKNVQLNFTPSQESSPISLVANSILADLKAQTLSIPAATLSNGSLNTKLRVKAQRILDKPTFSGQLQAEPFNLKNILKNTGKDLIAADSNALEKVSFSTQFTGTDSSIDLQSLLLYLDNSKIQGSFAVTNFATKALRFDLAIDQLDINKYLASTPDKQASSTAASASASATPVSTASTESHTSVFNEINANGSLRIGKLTTEQMVLAQVAAQIVFKNGLLDMNPLSANIYKGSMKGKVAVDFRNKTPKYIINETFTNIDMTELVKSGRLTGKANITTAITLQAAGNKAAMMRTLNGSTQFNLQNGALIGVNLPYQVERAVALFKRQAVPVESADKETRFDSLQGSATFNNGLFRNDDLLIKSDQFQGTGSGTADLVTEQLNYRLQFVGLHVVTSTQGDTIQEQRRTPIPIMITGTFSRPIIAPDLKVLFQSEIGRKVQQKLEEKLGPDASRAVGNILQKLLQ